MKYNTVIFDLDGTLLNSLQDLADSMNNILKKEGFPVRSVSEIQQFIGDGVRNLIIRALSKKCSEKDIEYYFQLFKKHYAQNMTNKTKPYDGIIDLLKVLHSRNIKIAIVSNKYDPAVKKLCEKYFDPYIQTAIGESNKIRRKPFPDGIFAAISELNSEKEECFYVGDSDIDIITARNAGIPAIGVTWGFRSKEVLLKENPWKIIDSPKEIIELL